MIECWTFNAMSATRAIFMAKHITDSYIYRAITMSDERGRILGILVKGEKMKREKRD